MLTLLAVVEGGGGEVFNVITLLLHYQITDAKFVALETLLIPGARYYPWLGKD